MLVNLFETTHVLADLKAKQSQLFLYQSPSTMTIKFLKIAIQLVDIVIVLYITKELRTRVMTLMTFDIDNYYKIQHVLMTSMSMQ
jgi:hypothetical protein